MKHLFQFCLLFILAGAAPLTFSSCSKKEDPAPTTGSLSGTISPAGTISKVTLVDAGGLTFFATINATGDTFSLDKLTPGTYKLVFEMLPGYYSTTVRLTPPEIKIVAGQTANAGTVAVESARTLRSAALSWTANGTSLTANNVQGSFDRSGLRRLTLTATAPSGNGVDEFTMSINEPDSRPNTYIITPNGGYGTAGVSYRRTSGQTTYYGRNNGYLSVTSLSNDLLTGTFEFTAKDNSGNNLSVTTGTFRAQF